MSRLNLVPELKFSEDFKQLRRDIQEIKKAQRIGRDIVRPKVIEAYEMDGVTPTEYDVETEDYDAGGGIINTAIQFRVTFIANHQTEPFANPQFKLMVNAEKRQPVAADNIYAFAYLDVENVELGKISYLGQVIANTTFDDVEDVFLKIYMYATDTGLITIKSWGLFEFEPED